MAGGFALALVKIGAGAVALSPFLFLILNGLFTVGIGAARLCTVVGTGAQPAEHFRWYRTAGQIVRVARLVYLVCAVGILVAPRQARYGRDRHPDDRHRDLRRAGRQPGRRVHGPPPLGVDAAGPGHQA